MACTFCYSSIQCALGKCTGTAITGATPFVSCYIKSDMKNSLMNLYNKIMLRKRAIIKIANNEIKYVCNIKHTRHRLTDNFTPNLVAGFIAYNLLPMKSSMIIDITDKSRVIA